MFLSKLFSRLQIPTALYGLASYDSLGETKISLRATSVPFLNPGDLVSFQYRGKWLSRRQLVIGCKRGRGGNFTSSYSGNWLLCALEIIEEPTPLTRMFNTYYKNPAAIQYFNDKRLGSPGKEMVFYYDFRTFIIDNIKNLYELEVKPTGRDTVKLN